MSGKFANKDSAYKTEKASDVYWWNILNITRFYIIILDLIPRPLYARSHLKRRAVDWIAYISGTTAANGRTGGDFYDRSEF